MPALTQAGKKKILSSLLFSLLKAGSVAYSHSGSVELEEARGQLKREGRREEREEERGVDV